MANKYVNVYGFHQNWTLDQAAEIATWMNERGIFAKVIQETTSLAHLVAYSHKPFSYAEADKAVTALFSN